MRDEAIDRAHKDITESLGDPPHAEAWEVAIRLRVVGEYIDGNRELDELEEWLDSYANTQMTRSQVRRELHISKDTEEPENFRRWAVDQIFSLDATQLEEVEAFRTRWLPDGLLDHHDVVEWISGQTAADGGSSEWITVLTDGAGVPVNNYQNQPGYKESGRILQFVDPDRRWIQSVSVGAFGALFELTEVASALNRRYDWSEAWASTFVLTGEVPPSVIARYSAPRSWPWYYARRRITITARLDVTPSQIQKIYRQERNRMLGGDPIPRAISEHKAKLGIFAAEHSIGYTWSETMRAWNDANPDRQYKREAQFTRDGRDAFNRIMGEPLNWHGKLESGEGRNGAR
jgi:hypothetical protein